VFLNELTLEQLMMPVGSFCITPDIRIGRKLRRCGFLVLGGAKWHVILFYEVLQEVDGSNPSLNKALSFQSNQILIKGVKRSGYT
jgi:hypothetical protein